MARYRKKPVVIEAVRITAADFNGSDWDGSPFSEMPDWLAEAVRAGTVAPHTRGHTDYTEWDIKTLEGTMNAGPGDMLIQGVKGEIYPCRSDIFAATYEPA
jgi:hypothetical protein